MVKKKDDAAMESAVSDTNENKEPAADKPTPGKKAGKKAAKAKADAEKPPEEKSPPDKGKPGKTETKNVTITDSINPFASAPPSTDTSATTVKTNPSGVPPATPAAAAASGREGPGWIRVSTRQWIRDFRDHVAKFQTFPYKSICGMFFWTFGYYPDMVSHESYMKYITKYPLKKIRHSVGSAQYYESAFTGSEMSSTTGVSGTTSAASSTVPGSATDTNMNKKGKKEEGKGAAKKGPAAPAESSATEASATETSGTETESKPKPKNKKWFK